MTDRDETPARVRATARTRAGVSSLYPFSRHTSCRNYDPRLSEKSQKQVDNLL